MQNETKPTHVPSMHVNETLVHNHTFLRALHDDGGYTTGLFGKYLNVMPDLVEGRRRLTDTSGFEATLTNEVQGQKKASPGIDAFMGNTGG